MTNSRQEAEQVTKKQIADQLDSMSLDEKRKFADWFNGFIADECAELDEVKAEVGTCEYCGVKFGGIDTHNFMGGGTCIPF